MRRTAGSRVSKATSSTTIRGSQRLSAPRTASSMSLVVWASTASNTKSWTPQPNSGRIGRSPGAVSRINPIACSMSVASPTMARRPRWSTPSGNASPRPRAPLTVRPSSEHHLRPGDLDHAASLDLHAGPDDLHLTAALDRQLRASRDLDLAGRGEAGFGSRLDLRRAAGPDARVALRVERQ